MKEIKKRNPTKAELIKLAKKAGKVDETNLAQVHETRMDIKKARIEIQKVEKQIISYYNDKKKNIKQQAEEMISIIQPGEERLEEIEKKVELEKKRKKEEERLKKEQRQKEMADKLRDVGYFITSVELNELDDDSFNKLYEAEKEKYEKKKKEQEEEKKKLEKEKKKLEKEKKKQEEKLKKEKEKLELERKKNEDDRKELEKEKKRIADEKKAKEDKIKKEKEDKERKIREEKEKKERLEREAKEENEREKKKARYTDFLKEYNINPRNDDILEVKKDDGITYYKEIATFTF